MFVLRFCAGPIVHKISPLGLLATCAATAAVGLYWLGHSGTSVVMLLAAATLYGCAKSFFWPTTLGTVSEQYPRGGALLLNAMGGVGMIAVGTIGGPAIGTLQDMILQSGSRSGRTGSAQRSRRRKNRWPILQLSIHRQSENRFRQPHARTTRAARPRSKARQSKAHFQKSPSYRQPCASAT